MLATILQMSKPRQETKAAGLRSHCRELESSDFFSFSFLPSVKEMGADVERLWCHSATETGLAMGKLHWSNGASADTVYQLQLI